MAQALITYRNVNIYQEDKLVLEKVNFTAMEGEFIYITGRVGSGKSSFLKSIYAEIPVNGNKKQRKQLEGQLSEAQVFDIDLLKLKRHHQPDLRRQLGVIFQDFQLLTDRTVEENLRFVLKATGWKKKDEIRQRIDDVLALVDMQHKAKNMPNELSGGEKQRIAIARAILNKPKLILADEPTGNLDPETSRNITELLHNICKSGSTVLMITHNLSLLEEYPARVFHCKDARLTELTSQAEAIRTEEEDEASDWKEMMN